MPYLECEKICSKCQRQGGFFRYRWHGQNGKYLFVSHCRECEFEQTKQHQKKNKEYWRKLNRESYLRTSEGRTSRRNNMNHTEESRQQWKRDKSNRRCTRAKEARFDDEFTKFVTNEAHELRKLRNTVTGFEWHVDHIIPLKGKEVCGLHIWSNLAVIPKKINLQKGAKIAVST